MTGKITRRTVARFHTVVSVESLRTHFVTPVTHPAWIAYALTIILPALGLVLAVALLIAVHSVEAVRADFLAIGTGPSGWALTCSRFVRALSTVPTGASVPALVAISSGWTRMFTGGSNVTRSARVLSGYVIARCIGNRTPFLTTVSEESVRAGVVTRGTGPSSRADAFTADRITRRVVVAGTYLVARLAVVA